MACSESGLAGFNIMLAHERINVFAWRCVIPFHSVHSSAGFTSVVSVSIEVSKTRIRSGGKHMSATKAMDRPADKQSCSLFKKLVQLGIPFEFIHYN